MRAVVRWGGAGLALLLGTIQFVPQARGNPDTDPAGTLTASTRVPDDVARVLDRACRDCHSNRTRWPWYSRVAPVSWFVVDHVNHGRSHFNYSEWKRYPPDEAARLLKRSCELVRDQSMPLRSYTLMHRDARLADTEVEALCAWATSSWWGMNGASNQRSRPGTTVSTGARRRGGHGGALAGVVDRGSAGRRPAERKRVHQTLLRGARSAPPRVTLSRGPRAPVSP